MEPSWDDPVARIMWLMEVGRNDEAFVEANHFIANSGWRSYEYAAQAARQRTRRRVDDPNSDIRRGFLDDFEEFRAQRAQLLNAVHRGYGLDVNELRLFASNMGHNDFNGMRHAFVEMNEDAGTIDTQRRSHRNAFNDVTNLRYRGTEFETDEDARGENVSPDPAAPSSPLRQDLSFKEPFPPAGWLKRQRE